MNSNALIIIVLIFLVAALSIGSFLLSKRRRKSGDANIRRKYNLRVSTRKALPLNEMYTYLIGYAANKLATENKPEEALYTREGDLRADIEKEISEKRSAVQDFLSDAQDDFENRLLAGGFIDESGKLPPEKVDPAANELYRFYKDDKGV